MDKREIKKLEDGIRQIQRELAALGPMRPGSISSQYNVCGNPGCQCKDPKAPVKHGPYYQLSYSHKGRSTTEFVKPENLEATKAMLKNYKRFRELTQLWIDLSVQLARLRRQAN